jgi:esterase/lipase superfamily enzyme
MEVKAVEKCILVLAADPRGTARFELEQEAATIERQLQQGRYGKDYIVRIEQGSKIEDLAGYLSKYRPIIVHVVGHGSATGEILLENDRQELEPVTAATIVKLFTAVEQQIECVLLNSCFSVEMADALIGYIPCTIGIDEEIEDPTIGTFTSEFYRGLGTGKGYYKAFELGRAQARSTELVDVDLPCFITGDRTLLNAPDKPLGKFVRSLKQQPVAPTPIRYPLWYGTNRKPIDLNDLTKGFSGDLDDRIHYGSCDVIVSRYHQIGSIGSSLSKGASLGFGYDDRNRLNQMAAGDFWANVQANLAQRNERERMAVVFIHGYNVSFDAAANCAAQIGCDLGIPGMTAFYSWPSKAKLVDYMADEVSIQASENQLAQFLTDFVAQSHAERVHIIAHSMGNRGLLRSLQRIATQFQGRNQLPFGQIFLAAPDEDPGVLRDLAYTFETIADRTTLYLSDRDKALGTSEWIHHQHPRKLLSPMTIVPGIDTVNVGNTDLSLFGHGYFRADRDVLADMNELLCANTSPERRFGLQTIITATDDRYWMMK